MGHFVLLAFPTSRTKLDHNCNTYILDFFIISKSWYCELRDVVILTPQERMYVLMAGLKFDVLVWGSATCVCLFANSSPTTTCWGEEREYHLFSLDILRMKKCPQESQAQGTCFREPSFAETKFCNFLAMQVERS